MTKEEIISLNEDLKQLLKVKIFNSQPYATAEKKLWWKEVVADERTGVTFDLYDVGLVFFDKSRVKEHRIVNFL